MEEVRRVNLKTECHNTEGVILISNSLNAFVKAFLKGRGIPSKGFNSHSLTGDGSKRLFIRIEPLNNHPSFVVMENPPDNEQQRKENFAYLMIGKHLFKKGLPVPRIYRSDLANGWFILEDMGDKSLQDYSSHHKDRAALYERIVENLFRMQIEGAEDFDTEWCCQTKTYNNFVMRRQEADYFRDSFLSNYLGIKGKWPELEDPFDYLCSMASRADNHHFMHRDFQSRNIMINNHKIGVLDWQGARLGPLPYDLASLLIDPYVDMSAAEKKHLHRHYLSLLKGTRPEWLNPFEQYFPYLAVQRNLQILGAFSFLSRVRGKTYFENYISPALNSLYHLLDDVSDPRLSSLTDIIHSLIIGGIQR
jgi:aminoglycoside/choline kinase family phosphotransferase